MIAGHRQLFEARCRQRGYTLDEVRPCIVSEQGDQITVDETHPAYPRDRKQAAASPPPPPSSGPGTELKALLKVIGITASPGCSCNTRAKIMDEKGPDWCLENIEEVCDWLQEEATKRKLPFLRAAGKLLIRKAVSNYRKRGQ